LTFTPDVFAAGVDIKVPEPGDADASIPPFWATDEVMFAHVWATWRRGFS